MTLPQTSNKQGGAPDTPDWVADAIFYQIFPDRFASSARVNAPGPVEQWGMQGGPDPDSRRGFPWDEDA